MSVHAYRSEAADRIVEDTIRGIAADLARLRVPRLAGVVLGGGYGRGEGGVWEGKDGSVRLSNDLDFFTVSEPGAGDAGAAEIARMLSPLGEAWSEKLGLDVDFTAKTPARLKKDEERLMVQELLRGYCDVWGMPGTELFAHLAKRDAAAVPWSEAARLLVNRGAGLLMAREEGRSGEFAARNLAKCVMGAGDARLVAGKAYRWKAEERAAALGDALYDAALAWKFRPREEPPCTWEEAREAWLVAEAEVLSAPGGGERSAKHAARWIVRRRTVGNWKTIGLDPIERLLREVAALVRGRRPFAPAVKRDWEVFN